MSPPPLSTPKSLALVGASVGLLVLLSQMPDPIGAPVAIAAAFAILTLVLCLTWD